MVEDPQYIGIWMKQKELTKTFMMISNWKNPFGCDFFYKLINDALMHREGLKG